MPFKDLLRKTLNLLHLDLTKNLEYDRLTKIIMKRVIKKDSNCIDVGCHKGEILDQILNLAPNGHHFAFEPLPHLYKDLQKKYKDKVTLYPFALSDKEGRTNFQFVKNAPAFSGIKKRSYLIEYPDIEEIEVEMKKLDHIIPSDIKIDLLKIDVEGGELAVLKGSSNILKNHKPIVVFECGLGASEHYGTEPDDVFNVVDQSDLRLSTLKSFISNSGALSKSEFSSIYKNKDEYYFVAHP